MLYLALRPGRHLRLRPPCRASHHAMYSAVQPGLLLRPWSYTPHWRRALHRRCLRHRHPLHPPVSWAPCPYAVHRLRLLGVLHLRRRPRRPCPWRPRRRHRPPHRRRRRHSLHRRLPCIQCPCVRAVAARSAGRCVVLVHASSRGGSPSCPACTLCRGVAHRDLHHGAPPAEPRLRACWLVTVTVVTPVCRACGRRVRLVLPHQSRASPSVPIHAPLGTPVRRPR
jgi:hypothetical protein